MQRRVLAPFDPCQSRVVPFELKWSLLRVLACFDPQWPVFILVVVDFEILLHCNRKVII